MHLFVNIWVPKKTFIFIKKGTNMEENTKIKLVDSESKDAEIYAFNLLINTILDYYCEMSEEEEPGEEWKKGTDHENKGKIPEDVDGFVKQAFKAQLKKFIK